MMENVINMIIIGLILGLTYALTSEGLWGAALMFFNVLFAAMIAFNFYEPLAALLDRTGINWGFSDTLCMMGLFCIALVMLRMTTETLAPAQVRFPTPIYHIGRLVFGLAGAVVTMAVIILAFHAAPVHKKIFQAVRYDTKPPFRLGIDHQWLGFFQHATGTVFARYGVGGRDPFREYGHGGPVQVFDPRAEWLINHEQVRPYGEGSIIGGEEEAAAAEGAQGQAPAGRAGGRRGAPAPGGPPP